MLRKIGEMGGKDGDGAVSRDLFPSENALADAVMRQFTTLLAFQAAAEESAREEERLRLGDGWIGTRSVASISSSKRWRRKVKRGLRRVFSTSS